MESTAASILTRAVEMDKKEQYTLALVLYQEGLQILVDSMKGLKDEKKKKHFSARIEQYFKRAEDLKELIRKRKAEGKYREQMKIEAGSVGHGYRSLFGRFLDDTVTHVHIEDPYVRAYHQCLNLVRLCELAVQRCKSLSRVSLLTTQDPEDGKNQVKRLEELRSNLATRLVTFEVKFSDTLHDRQISLSNGWVIKIGRGLDYFKAPEGKFVLGACDMELRPCLETTVDIFHTSHLERPL
ncbi:MIT domain-containing protein 1-like [Fopius arisanus]|uniref:MIT domain-containing protein 1-like n=1 Tax=Fopius arisanus TaxID=64838 RepID=A0A9R1SW04_9HYME|nr:PREDICTED: MIT domain-containing protein 1-like [Fopius arisanus]XP_011298172.1 PREDICTED: MIT domain-containing protein 1-like [Fopius arisanus]XP_011298173.1 PREDICTED: MIT domain-containing protein 1-like [Fopius arisanus]